jgi:hypothetical protein
MKRFLLSILAGYVLIAAGNKVAEAAGAMTCGCAEDCWCKRPGLSLFRWVFPWRHHSTHSGQQKADLDSAHT